MVEHQNFKNTLLMIPTYDERENVQEILGVLFDKYPELTVLIVDDNSPDGTQHQVRELQEKYENLHLIVQEKKLGLARAYKRAFQWGLERDFSYFIQMDCDFSHDPDEIQHLQRESKTYDLVIGSRYIEGVRITNWPFYRLCLSYLASLYVQWITRAPIKDPTSGFKCFKRETLEAIELDKMISEGYIFQFELSFKAWAKGFKIKERPITFHERRDGQSKLGQGIVLEALINVLRLKARHIFKTL